MGTWIQDYIKTYDPAPFIAYMCAQLSRPGGCIDQVLQAAVNTGYASTFLLMGG